VENEKSAKMWTWDVGPVVERGVYSFTLRLHNPLRLATAYPTTPEEILRVV